MSDVIEGLSHILRVRFSRDRAAEAVAWLFVNVGRFDLRTIETLPNLAVIRMLLEFYELEDAAKFKLMFGSDDLDNFA